MEPETVHLAYPLNSEPDKNGRILVHCSSGWKTSWARNIEETTCQTCKSFAARMRQDSIIIK